MKRLAILCLFTLVSMTTNAREGYTSPAVRVNRFKFLAGPSITYKRGWISSNEAGSYLDGKVTNATYYGVNAAVMFKHKLIVYVGANRAYMPISFEYKGPVKDETVIESWDLNELSYGIGYYTTAKSNTFTEVGVDFRFGILYQYGYAAVERVSQFKTPTYSMEGYSANFAAALVVPLLNARSSKWMSIHWLSSVSMAHPLNKGLAIREPGHPASPARLIQLGIQTGINLVIPGHGRSID